MVFMLIYAPDPPHPRPQLQHFSMLFFTVSVPALTVASTSARFSVTKCFPCSTTSSTKARASLAFSISSSSVLVAYLFNSRRVCSPAFGAKRIPAIAPAMVPPRKAINTVCPEHLTLRFSMVALHDEVVLFKRQARFVPAAHHDRIRNC